MMEERKHVDVRLSLACFGQGVGRGIPSGGRLNAECDSGWSSLSPRLQVGRGLHLDPKAARSEQVGGVPLPSSSSGTTQCQANDVLGQNASGCVAEQVRG